jgi:hypothetical protein
MEKIGLANRVTKAVLSIALGRRGLATIGREGEGGPPYQQGLSQASQIFDEVFQLRDVELLLHAEHTFLLQEYRSCDESDTEALSSAKQAV